MEQSSHPKRRLRRRGRALGLRNPWRFSFDRLTGDLYARDVRRAQYEEGDFRPASSGGRRELRPNIMEGPHCYPGPLCDDRMKLAICTRPDSRGRPGKTGVDIQDAMRLAD